MKTLCPTIFYAICLVFFAVMVGCDSGKKHSPAQVGRADKEPVSIILDTDIGPDIDDVGALAVLHALADNGEARILGVMSCNPNQWTVPAIDVINTYFGRGDLPIGAPKNGGVVIANMHGWNEAIVLHYPHNLDSAEFAGDAVASYRKILAAQPDSSVVIVTVGFLTNLKNLLVSPADEWSSMSGKQLVAKKVRQLVAMGGQFPKGKEFNLKMDTDAAMAVIETWPTAILFSGVEIGEKVLTGSALMKDSTLANSPVRETYQYYLQKDKKPSRPSWDQTAVLVAVRGLSGYFEAIPGQCKMFSDGHNEWADTPKGAHRYLTFKMAPAKIQVVIEDLMRHPPK
jgi:inosine-uridine nucleoside N-ribohydrolase